MSVIMSLSRSYLIKQLLLYKAILKPIWTYGLMGHSSNSNRNITKISKQYLGIIAPWYVINDTLHCDLNVPYIRDEIKGLRYADRMEQHPNTLASCHETSQTTPIKRKTTSRLMYLTYCNFIEQTSLGTCPSRLS